MPSDPYEIPWRQVKPGMQIAVERPARGFAWSLEEFQRDPSAYDWRLVIGRDHEGPVIHRGGVGRNGRNVVVRDLDPPDRDAVVVTLDRALRANRSGDRVTERQLMAEVVRLGDSLA